jgi:hypothetical protein
MEFAPGEVVRMEAEEGKLVLTNYRVYLHGLESEGPAYLSMSLDAVASCSLALRGEQYLLIASAAALLLGATLGGVGFFFGLILGAALAGYWYQSRVPAITIASIGGERITVEVKGAAREKALEFLRTVETEKLRFLGKIGA